MGNIFEKAQDEERQGEALSLGEEVGSKKLYLESYGCAMNFSDSEVVAFILAQKGYSTTQDYTEADLVLINTCSVRDNAETRVRNRLSQYNVIKKERPGMIIGMLGCMAERLKSQVLEEEKLVDIVAGPDSYRSLPELIEEVEGGQKAVNVLLSRDETYADISPVRLDKNGVTGFVSITRGCDNMCSFCVVPFTRGRERSRDPHTIVRECQDLYNAGYREVTLLGQNVNSYRWNMTSKGEVKNEAQPTTNFAELLEMVAEGVPAMRIRFSTPHPKDFTEDVLHTVAKYKNICKCIHLPIQSGNSEVLKRMNRGYTREWYLDRVADIRRILPDCGITTDTISGFCGETEEEHADLISVMKEVKYDAAYMYKYSERPKTLAERKYDDDVPEDVKQRRLEEVITLQHEHSLEINQQQIGKIEEVLIETVSRRSDKQMMGRTDRNHKVIFDRKNAKIGDFVMVKITSCTSASLMGEIVDA
ncbi:MAG TPA: tRNA (N6-isopentenyl adenosine(37)-C2)-methylthiotransferase MiaB [Brumimicrobium sp.]|nr:tRNA (N6-isopentenyl adenosine(37)-C2)-methylthiotransferase MiaB [Brumimicrobium sp.]